MNVPAVKKSTFSWTTDSITGGTSHSTKIFFINIPGLPEITCVLSCTMAREGSDYVQYLGYELAWEDCQATPIFYMCEANVYHRWLENYRYPDRWTEKKLWTDKKAGPEGTHLSSAETFPKYYKKSTESTGELRVDIVFEFNMFMSCTNTYPTPLSELAVPLLNEGIFSDVVVICGDKTFNCHKVVLAGCSEVLKKMVTAPFREASENKIELKEMTEDVAELLINFIYANELPEDSVSWALFEAAKMYDLPKLMLLCVNILGKHLSIGNSCEMLLRAHKHGLDDMFSYALEFIRRNKAEVSTTDGWTDVVNGDSEFIAKVILAAL